MLLPHGTVFALVDGERFELYRNTGIEADPDLTPLPVPELQPSNKSAGTRHQARSAEPMSNRLDEDAHVAAVADWLNEQVLKHEIDKLVVIADPKSLGEMRRRYHKMLREVLLAEFDRTLTGRRPDEIVRVLRGR